MNELIVESTRKALAAVSHPRYYKSERGFQGGFYCALLNELDERKLIDDRRILEQEYQKWAGAHRMTQRPDIVYHIPVEISGAGRDENNYAVWALKREADIEDAVDDFRKLDEMFDRLRYPLGVFININRQQDFLEHYKGPFRERLFGFSVCLQEGTPTVEGRACNVLPT